MLQALREAKALLPVLTPPSYWWYPSQSLHWWQEESVVWAQRASIPSTVFIQAKFQGLGHDSYQPKSFPQSSPVQNPREALVASRRGEN